MFPAVFQGAAGFRTAGRLRTQSVSREEGSKHFVSHKSEAIEMPWGKGDSIVAGEEAQLEPVARAGNGKGQGTGGRWPRGSTLMTKQMHKNSRNPDDPREKLKKISKKSLLT